MLFSGRIAYPHITLTTWGTCPFVIERAKRLDRRNLLVVGREAGSDCESKKTRHVTTQRLTGIHAKGGENVDRVTVVSRRPAYRVAARVKQVVA